MRIRNILFAVALPTFGAADNITFSGRIAPILLNHCAPCHQPGEAAPFSLLTYADARKRGRLIADVTARRYMPPWLPEPGHGEFAGSRRLSGEQIAAIAQWVRGGMPEGNPADSPPVPRVPAGWQLGPPDMIVSMAQPFRLAATDSDVFRNFVLPVELKQTKYIRAFELRPGNRTVVHHANIVVDRSRLLRRRDGQDGQAGFPGMDVETEAPSEFDPDSHFLFWKPGSPAQLEPPGMPWKLDPDSDLILNLHFKPSGKPETIGAEVGLYFSPNPPNRQPMLLQLEHDGAIDIPPGSATASVTDRLKLPVAVSLLAIYPHAHYLGKEVEAWAELPDRSRRDLLKIVRWDINWQAAYEYREPVRLPAGTWLAMRIRYDNTESNPANPNHPPKRVRAGNQGVDEMGHVWLQVLPGPAGENDPRLLLQKAVMERRLEKYPADFAAHFNLGAALQSLGQTGQALSQFQAATRMRPSSAAVRNNLAVALFSSERFAEAAKEFRAALALDPAYRSARYNLARSLQMLGDNAGALRELQADLASHPADAEANELAGRLCVSSSRFADAVPYFRKAAEADPNNAAFLINLGAALASVGDFSAAEPILSRAVQLDPSNQPARDNLARVRRLQPGAKP